MPTKTTFTKEQKKAAVLAVLKGKTRKEVARLYKVSIKTLGRWVADAHRKGLKFADDAPRQAPEPTPPPCCGEEAPEPMFAGVAMCGQVEPWRPTEADYLAVVQRLADAEAKIRSLTHALAIIAGEATGVATSTNNFATPVGMGLSPVSPYGMQGRPPRDDHRLRERLRRVERVVNKLPDRLASDDIVD